ncbi:SMP-30/gluconolactonase/LRE family protein [Mycobacterium bourgelatii]|uniref:SMP-30/gluconolactonase/LRE family protein n=1 Tax=Mycobacterium bourgelatii TaxID=1273442 RepID=UPI0021F3C078|nr:SMP-30/gluconolactonase/LRE family protein [Mycobacterium bourgelatii]MCV6976513.1 SMP-30/gluconolactonase/LRE family protein [Mycobacterium bourgelatii]
MARYPVATSPRLAEGWTLTRLTPPSRLFGANGLRTGPDGRVYIAQVTGSQISALDVATGKLDTISAKGSDIIAPDDVAFDPAGNLYATEVMDGRVSVRDPAGRTRVLRADVPSANGITVHQGRLFIGECREGGRLLELDLNGGPPRVLLENVPSPNAMEVGPDGLLYFPVMGANEIWRIDLEGGEPQRVAGDLGVPDAVKFDAEGYLVSTQVHSGQVLRIDPRNGDRTVLANLNPGLDNLTFVGGRLFVSNFTGEITEILGDGESQTVLAGGLNWPLDLAVGADGLLYIADGTYFYALDDRERGDERGEAGRSGSSTIRSDDRERGEAGRSGSSTIRSDDRERGEAGRSGSSTIRSDDRERGTLRTAGMLFSPGYPGFLRGVAATGPGEFIVTTSNGEVARYRPQANESDFLATGFDQLYGIAVAPSGAVLVAELGTGRVLSIAQGQANVVASGLNEPVGVAIAPDGACLVSESGGGRVVKLDGTGTVVEGLQRPQGILVLDNTLYVVDAGAKEVVAVELADGTRHTIAADLPVGAPPGVTPKPLRGMPPFSGPQGPFAGIAAGPDGTLYVSADGDGSVLALRRGS